ncbi:MAG: tRNA (N6-threonylcarbamoyladenosine(37)-N6)-methyltransferase TrmO [Chloroflexi bacterium]|nr:tRNA (N6-threonylcarbamoyladenosine(37)-N6)-methyltransferase TrmO [Chloroflexota bacterium]MBU1661536.1 tRNA (N6-threonylcarbamoyladenosine(37)-N6)-methyltransferase TrmO [Chloroflexota bacterium]
MKSIIYQPIGIIHSPFAEPQGTPIQPAAAQGVEGRVEIFPQFVEGINDLDGFSHVILLYHFHRVKETKLTVKPFMDNEFHGVFATRAPSRPNPIGLSIVRLVGVDGRTLLIQDVDILDGTPLLDIKPYVREFDIREIESQGWLEKNVNQLPDMKDDGRFVPTSPATVSRINRSTKPASAG